MSSPATDNNINGGNPADSSSSNTNTNNISNVSDLTTAAIANATGSAAIPHPDLPGYNVTLVPWVVRPTTEASPPPECQWSSNFTIVSGCLAVIFLLFGILLTFFGYRFFKAVMFLTGFIFSSVLVFMIMEEQDIIPPEGNLGVAGGAGLLLGLVTMLIQYTGLFVSGFNFGVAVVVVGLVVVEQFLHPSTKWIPIGVLIAVGVLFGILALRFQKAMTVLGTSAIGAALIVAGADYFVEYSRMALYLWDRVLAQSSPELCWYSWVMFGIWPAVTLLGIFLQWRFTSAGVDHRVALRTKREQTANLQQNRARMKRETQQTRYRHLYQARRVKGDVISQNFLHSIQDKLSPDMRSLTTLNTEPNNEEDSTATTTLTQIT